MSDLEDICQMTESIEYNNIQCKNSSKSNSPDKKIPKNVKCFKCGGRQPQIKQCQQCKHRGYIYQSHPMCQLLNDILLAKLSHQYFSGSLSMNNICPISQQSSVVQQKINICDECGQQCDNTNYNYCLECPHYFLCKFCKEDGKHQHQLINYCSEQKKITIDCDNCQRQLQNVYLKCPQCQRKGIVYKLCTDCHSDCKIKHPHASKLFKPALLMDSKSKCSRSKVSKTDLFEQQRYNQLGLQIKLTKVRSQITSNRQVSLTNIQSDIKIRGSTNGLQQLQQSQVFVQCQLLASFDYQEVLLNNNKNQIQQPLIRQVQSQDSQGQYSQQSSQKSTDYLFKYYQCDICNVNPIRKVRYHCQQCQDYDLCSNCYKKKRNLHEHKNYRMIDGAKTIKQQLQVGKGLVKKLLQSKRSKS